MLLGSVAPANGIVSLSYILDNFFDREHTFASSYFISPPVRSHGFHCLRGNFILLGKLELWVEYQTTYDTKERFIIQRCQISLGLTWRTIQVEFFIPEESQKFELVFKLDFDKDGWMRPLRLVIDEISIEDKPCNNVGELFIFIPNCITQLQLFIKNLYYFTQGKL